MRFRPTLKDLIKEYRLGNKLYVPKNSGLAPIRDEVMKKLGLGEGNDQYIEVEKTRGESIPLIIDNEYLQKKRKPAGLTGDDLYDEYVLRNPNSKTSILETFEWYDEHAMFRRPTLCLMKPKGKNLEKKLNMAVNAKYELTSKQFMKEYAPGMAIKFDAYAGDTELMVARGLADACIEVVYSGSTIKKFGLEIVERVRSSDLVIIGVDESSPKSFQLDYQQIITAIKNPRQGSFVQSLVQDQNKLVKKLGEEFAEYIRAVISGQDIVPEFADLYCMMSIAASGRGVEFKDISKEILLRINEKTI